MPNIRQSFKMSSFSVQFNAIKDIKPGEQLCYAYCFLDKSALERQAQLKPYGFVCNCSACVNATPETDHFRKTFVTTVKQLAGVLRSGGVLESALNLEQGMIKEGLDGDPLFFLLVLMIIEIYSRLGMTEEATKYEKVAKAFESLPIDAL
jgi:hypothetical protein